MVTMPQAQALVGHLDQPALAAAANTCAVERQSRMSARWRVGPRMSSARLERVLNER